MMVYPTEEVRRDLDEKIQVVESLLRDDTGTDEDKRIWQERLVALKRRMKQTGEPSTSSG